jgi:hypothetical protein
LFHQGTISPFDKGECPKGEGLELLELNSPAHKGIRSNKNAIGRFADNHIYFY